MGGPFCSYRRLTGVIDSLRMPNLDPTSMVLFAAGSVGISLLLCTVLRRLKRNDPAIRWLIASNLAFLVAAAGVLASPVLMFEASAALVISAAFAGICCGWFAVLRAEGAALPVRPVLFGGGAALAAQAGIAGSTDGVEALMLSSSVVNSVLLIAVIARLWTLTRRHSRRMASLICLPFGLLLLGYGLRIPVVLFVPDMDAALLATLLIVVAMAWASVVLELALIALREAQVQAQLRSALERAEIATKARTRFLLGISHDLRTPLNAILGLSELMRNQVMGPLPTAYAQPVEHIHENGAALNELVGDLLMLASTEEPGSTPNNADLRAAVQDKFASEPGAFGPAIENRIAAGRAQRT